MGFDHVALTTVKFVLWPRTMGLGATAKESIVGAPAFDTIMLAITLIVVQLKETFVQRDPESVELPAVNLTDLPVVLLSVPSDAGLNCQEYFVLGGRTFPFWSKALALNTCVPPYAMDACVGVSVTLLSTRPTYFPHSETKAPGKDTPGEEPTVSWLMRSAEFWMCDSMPTTPRLELNCGIAFALAGT
jgi:hypothetical protein